MKPQRILPITALAVALLSFQSGHASAAESPAVQDAIAAEKAALAEREKRRAEQEAEAAGEAPQPPAAAEPEPPESTAADTATVPRDVAPATEPMTQSEAETTGSVARAAFTTMVRDREPMDDIKTLANDVGEINFFTELHDMSGQTAVHRWEYDGEVMAEVSFDVRGPRWRVWSSKQLLPEWTGTWKVSVINGAGDVIYESMLDYVPATTDEAVP